MAVVGGVAAQTALVARRDHVVRPVELTAVEVARLKGLLTFPAVGSFVDGVVGAAIVVVAGTNGAVLQARILNLTWGSLMNRSVLVSARIVRYRRTKELTSWFCDCCRAPVR